MGKLDCLRSIYMPSSRSLYTSSTHQDICTFYLMALNSKTPGWKFVVLLEGWAQNQYGVTVIMHYGLNSCRLAYIQQYPFKNQNQRETKILLQFPKRKHLLEFWLDGRLEKNNIK